MPIVVFMSRAAALGMHAMAMLACHDDTLIPTRVIARDLGVSEAHLAKVLHRLHRHGLVVAVRARGGGIRLAKAAREVTLLQILETIDGTAQTPACPLGTARCTARGCVLGELSVRIDAQVRDYLGRTALSAMVPERREAAVRSALGAKGRS